MTYQPAPQQQYVPVTASSGDDCVPTCCAMGADRATVGAKVTNHAAIRKASGQASGGLSYQTAVIATQRVTGVVGQARFWLPPADVKALLLAGRACTVSIDTHATAGTPERTNAFLGGHSVQANSYNPANDTVRIKDPGTRAGYLDWPWALLVKAAELRSGNRGMNVIAWPDTEGVARIGVAPGQFYAAPNGGSIKKGNIIAGKPYTVVSTTNGGGWPRADGGISNGWHRTSVGLFAPGKELR